MILHEKKKRFKKYAFRSDVESISNNSAVFSEDSVNIFREGLPKFDFVSFREKRGAEMYFEIMGKKAEILLEPVMYVSKEHWRSLEKCPKGFENRSYIFEYFIDENREQWSVEEFLYLIDHAEKVVTNSYHACVFAIIFGKPFKIVERKGIAMQSRFDTLLQKSESGID